MALIKMTPEQLRSSATQYQRGSQSVTEVLNQLTRTQQEIEADWQGHGFDRFNQEFQKLAPKIRQFAELLEEINHKLDQSADAMENTDQQIAGQF